eukprot:PhM_4_TR7943/c0_g1_i1/m.53665
MSTELQRRIAEAGDSDDEEAFAAYLDTTKGNNSESLTFGQWVASVASRLLSYCRITTRELRKRPMSYCLGTSSCLLVVMITCVMMTVLDNVPAVFLRLAETENAERDLVLQTGAEAEAAQTLNYTQFRRAVEKLGTEYSFHSPRIEIPASQVNAFPKQCASGGFDLASIISLCVLRQQTTAFVIDTERERRAEMGKDWTGLALSAGEAILDDSAASRLRLAIGDEFIVHMVMSPQLIGPIQAVGFNASSFPAVIMTLRLAGIVSSPGGKFPNDESDYIVFEYAHFFETLAGGITSGIDAARAPAVRSALASLNAYDFATEISMNYNPDTRFQKYNSNNYRKIQRTFIDFWSPVVLEIGFNQISADPPVLTFMSETQFFAMFLGLLISIIIVILTVISMVLIYSLMMVNIGTRTFELGVMRMLGMDRTYLIQLVLVQSQFFAIPSWVVGLVIGQLAYLGISSAVESLLGVKLSPLLSPTAVGIATLLGLVIPVLASIAPIMHVLETHLTSALDVTRSKATAVIVTIERMSSSIAWDVVGIGAVLAVFGFMIYYLFPMSLLQSNLALLFYIFFGVLIGMLLGLVLLALNFQAVLERGITALCFFWEKRAIRKLIIKNLIAHRLRNRKTTLMYSLSLAFILFITVMFNIQIESFKFLTLRGYGSEVIIRGYFTFTEYSAIEKAVRGANMTSEWSYLARARENNQISTVGRYRSYRTRMHGVSPNFWEVADPDFLSVGEEAVEYLETDVSLGEYLYTEDGSSRAVVGSAYTTLMSLNTDTPFMFKTEIDRNVEGKEVTTTYWDLTRPLVFLSTSPVLIFSKFIIRVYQPTVVSLPSLVRLSHGETPSIRHLTFRQINLKLVEPYDDGDVSNAIKLALPNSNRIDVMDYDTAVRPMDTAKTALNAFFCCHHDRRHGDVLLQPHELHAHEHSRTG